ncbi:MAG: AmmeMemoRadiSam system protein B [Candidatus Omnitrophica bacterium]|nr:AmmeMemoRadiSam system protein B [Candidatus Omnitrophota bacterium]MBU4473424.1 AmmeMemoRadiSam system protein B [Candidatus Omnitrophota bacterium]MCG2706241.1 AmmeMemoRadiSam system protein B [Candidatus Omnitrophota bacterium]
MEKSKIRKPAVAGQFYPSSAQDLKNEIGKLIDKKAAKSDVIACMLPHAGYAYSGKVAADTVSSMNIKDKVILIGPNHTGYGATFSIMAEGIWQTPLGEIKIDNGLTRQILSRCKYLEDDNRAHLYEHSLEVELPFLQYFKDDFEIVPIVVLSGELVILKAIGRDIANVINESDAKSSTIIVASTDMTHYEPQDEAVQKDKEAIQAILELDEEKLTQKVQSLSISMCGWAPTVVMLAAAKLLGAQKAKLIKYQTSGDVTGDKHSVVGYAGIIIY